MSQPQDFSQQAPPQSPPPVQQNYAPQPQYQQPPPQYYAPPPPVYYPPPQPAYYPPPSAPSRSFLSYIPWKLIITVAIIIAIIACCVFAFKKAREAVNNKIAEIKQKITDTKNKFVRNLNPLNWFK